MPRRVLLVENDDDQRKLLSMLLRGAGLVPVPAWNAEDGLAILEDCACDADLGLAQYQTKTWPGWYRHTTLVMAAHSFLIGMELGGGKRAGAGDDTAAQGRRRTGT